MLWQLTARLEKATVDRSRSAPQGMLGAAVTRPGRRCRRAGAAAGVEAVRRGMCWRVSFVLAITSAALCAIPAASGGLLGSGGQSLALVPLPRAAIGKAARSLRLEPGSGIVSNASAGEVSGGFETAKSLARAGRVTGYRLTYGDDLAGSAPVAQVSSLVSEWRSPTEARRGFGRGVADDLAFGGLSRFGVKTRVVKANGAAVGAQHVLLMTSYRFSHRTVYEAWERATDGRYTLDVDVSGAGPAPVRHLGSVLLRRLDRRLRLARAGRLRGKPVRGPNSPKPGPPARGPKPASLALRGSDLPGYSRQAGYYGVGLGFASSYVVRFSHGCVPCIDQQVAMADNSITATFWSALLLWNDTHAATYNGAKSAVRARSLRLPGVADHARGEVVRVPFADGRVSYIAQITLRRGRWLDSITALLRRPISTSDIRKLARLAAYRLDRGLHG